MKNNILFTTGCIYTKNSGTYHSLLQTIDELNCRGHEVSVIGTKGRIHNVLDKNYKHVSTNVFRRYGPDSLHFAPTVKQWLKNEELNWQLVSMQGVWLHLNSYIANWCIKKKRPFMLTPHGSFNEYALGISSWKKRLADSTFMTNIYKNVSCYQALTESEYVYLRERGIKAPICTIGNGIKIPDINSMSSVNDILPEIFLNKPTCLYIGRLTPIKGLERLIQAWKKLVPYNSDWQLIIAGSGDAKYERKLHLLAGYNKDVNIYFVGAVHHDVKAAWLRQTNFLVLPSYSEAFPMSILEGLSYQKPCLLTSTCGLPEIENYAAGIEVPSCEQGIMEGLQHMLNLSPTSLKNMGLNGFNLIKSKYQWSQIVKELEGVYAWLTGNGQKPSCVQIV